MLGGVFLTRDRIRPADQRALDTTFAPDRFFDALLAVFFSDAPAGDQGLSADTDNRWENVAVIDTPATVIAQALDTVRIP